MALVCPDCRKPTLEIQISVDLGPNDSSDEYAVQALACDDCGLRAGGTYEESRRGARDSFHHTGYRIDDAAWRKLKKALSRTKKLAAGDRQVDSPIDPFDPQQSFRIDYVPN